MLPPQPLPLFPQGADRPPLPPLALLPGCFLALFWLGWDFWFWSCGLPLRSNVSCVQPVVARDSEQKSARRKRFFFTGPPLSEFQKEHVATRFHVRYQDLAKAAPHTRQQLCSHVESRCHFRAKGLLDPGNSQKWSQSENPGATRQTRVPLFESKSLLEQNCGWLSASLFNAISLIEISRSSQLAFTEVFS